MTTRRFWVQISAGAGPFIVEFACSTHARVGFSLASGFYRSVTLTKALAKTSSRSQGAAHRLPTAPPGWLNADREKFPYCMSVCDK